MSPQKIFAIFALLAPAIVRADDDCMATGQSCDAPTSPATASRVLLQRDLSSKEDMVLTATEDESFLHAAFGKPFNATKALDSLMALDNKGGNKKKDIPPELKALLDTLVDIVKKAKGDEKFKESLAEAQQAINASVTEVNTLDGQKDKAKLDGDTADEALVKCVQEEKEMLEQVKKCEADMDQDKDDEDEACKEKEEARPFEVNLTGSCDLGNKDCASMVSKLKEDLRAVESVLADRKEKFSKLEAACNESISREKQLKEECANKTAALTEKVQECMAKELDASKAKCRFGTRAQQMCHAWNEYTALVASHQKNDAKRKEGWINFETLECILVHYKKSVTIKQDCKEKIDYERDVGVLDKMEDKIDEECTKICSASTVTFSGFKWQVPSPRGAKASPEDYVKNTASPAITITPVGTDPLEECGSSEATKATTTAAPEES